MKSTTPGSRRRQLVIAVLIIVACVLDAAEKIFEYSAPPTGSKNCDFVFLPNRNQTKPTLISTPEAPARFQISQLGGTINDASCRNKTTIYGIAKIQTVEYVQSAVQFAHENRLKVTPAGARHSMGGQSFNQNGIVLDMGGFKRLKLVHKDTTTALPYATQEMFAYVLYFNQHFNEKEGRALQKTTVDLIDLALRLNGTYYLPYQLFYSPAQLREAYPGIDDFFKAKLKYDPIGLFTNKFYEIYGQ